MNRLPHLARQEVLRLLLQGSSLRAASRATGVSRITITRLLLEGGAVCERFHDALVRGVHASTVRIAEQCPLPAGNPPAAAAPGDVPTCTASDPDTGLVASWLVGPRTARAALQLVEDLASRVVGPVQLTNGAGAPYDLEIGRTFSGCTGYPQLVCAVNRVLCGTPDRTLLATSFPDRQSLVIGEFSRSLASAANAFPRALERRRSFLAIYFTWHNWARPNSSLGQTPAVAAGLSEGPYDLGWLARLVEAG